MAAQLKEWTPETERAFKEVLYRFMGEIHSTKAALYLKTPDNTWALATQYGFGRRDSLSETLADDHVLVRMVRAFADDPRAYNEPAELGAIASYLAGAGTSKLMLVPLASADELLGFVDVRDKGRQQPFNSIDLDLARAIATALTRLTESTDLFGVAEAVVEAEPEAVKVATADRPVDSEGEPAALLDDWGLDEICAAASDALVDPRVAAVALTIASPRNGATLVLQREGAPAFDPVPILEHQKDAMRRAAVPAPPDAAWKTDLRRVLVFGAAARAPVIASSVLLDGSGSSVLVSVIGDGEPAVAREALERVRQRALAARDRFQLRISRRGLARRLLQPGNRRYPELVAHSLGVSRLCWSLAKALEFDDWATEEAALAGLLHDVGMRELDYDRLYMHPTPGPEDRRTYRMHVDVGDRIVRVEGFSEIADAVRHHHERWDGNGYPDRLAGAAIPILARVVHVAEVFDLFTAANSYRPAVSHDRAMAILARAAGHQFDPDVVEALTRVVA
jgi:hypothetical protein